MKTLIFLFLLSMANMAFAISEDAMDCGYGTPEVSLSFADSISFPESADSSKQ